METRRKRFGTSGTPSPKRPSVALSESERAKLEARRKRFGLLCCVSWTPIRFQTNNSFHVEFVADPLLNLLSRGQVVELRVHVLAELGLLSTLPSSPTANSSNV